MGDSLSDILRKMNLAKKTNFTQDIIKTICINNELFTKRENHLGIVSNNWQDGKTVEALSKSNVLNLTEYFDGRLLKYNCAWKNVRERINNFCNSLKFNENYLITLSASYSVCFACGKQIGQKNANITFNKQTINDLLPLAEKQIEIAKKQFNGNAIEDCDRLGWCFLDWSLELNKQAGAQAVYIYAEKSLVKLLKELQKDTSVYEQDIALKSVKAIEKFYDKEQGLFVSGEQRQISYATNVWYVLAEVFGQKENAFILEHLKTCENVVKPVTPYMMHHYVQALINSGNACEGRKVMCDYWGGMAERGADTFWELYNPENPDESPYGGKAVNSYCHAWSCTPSYFLRKYFAEV